MNNQNMYTPEGMQDILYGGCRLKREIEESLRSLFRGFAYREIETPALEFAEVFATEDRAFGLEGMFKFFDENGRVLVLKPDQTIPAARVAASRLKGTEPWSRISYVTQTYRFRESGAGRQKEYTQAGCELINAAGPLADAEILALSINALLCAGLKDFQIDIGQVDFFKGLMEESGIDVSASETVRQLIDKKDYLGLEEILRKIEMPEDLKKQILDLPTYFGDIEQISELRKTVRNKKALEALGNLAEIYNILKEYGLDAYVSVDLGMVQSINYYTGLIFKGYTYGIGFPVLNGGRYDRLLSNFGSDMPAVGFSVNVNQLAAALTRQNPDQETYTADTFISFDPGCEGEAYAVASALRQQGLSVASDLSPSDAASAASRSASMQISGLVYICSDGKIRIINNITGAENITSVTELTGGVK